MIRKTPKLLLLFVLSLCALALLYGTRSMRRASAASGETTKPATKATLQTLSPADGGSWDGLLETADVPVHISLLPDGRLLYWGRDKEADGWDATGHSNTFTVDPLYLDHTSYTALPSPTPSTNLFCSGHSFLPDGRLLVAGGHIKDSRDPKRESIGEKSINIFDYRTNLWTKMPPAQEMEKGRWYPYNVTMPSGETLILAGRYLVNPPPAPIVTDDNKEPSLRDLQGNIDTLLRGVVSSPRVYTYPYLALAPDGRVFIAKPNTVGSSPSFLSLYFDPYAPNDFGGNGVFTTAASPLYRHWEGTSVMYAPGKMLLIGGSEGGLGSGTVNVAAVEAINLNLPSPTWSQISPLAQPRQFQTGTLLPDGKVLVTGGTSCGGVNRLDCGPGGTYGGAVQTPELWDPERPSEGWKQMNPTTSGVPRVYHSTALLLPDARVLVGGGGLPAAAGETAINPTTGASSVCAGTGPDDTLDCRKLGHKNVEIFSPPYLYNANGSPAIRPAIVSAPESITYGQQFLIDVGNINIEKLKKVVLVRLPSVTHTYNQDQRRIDLGAPVAVNDTYVSVTAPANGIACPPGPYMMFLISNNGRETPSVAKIVRVGDYSANSSLNHMSRSFPATQGDEKVNMMNWSINVTAAPGVSWTATSNSAWLTINSGSSGTGNGTVNFKVADNTGTTARTGVITIRVPGREALGLNFVAYQSVNFADVSTASTLYRFISALHARGITSGCSTFNNSYCPDNFATRAQMTVFLTRIIGNPSAVPDPVSGGVGFSDAETHSFRKYISYTKRRRILDGCGLNTFCPEQTLTRRDMVVWTLRAMGMESPPKYSSQPFNDIPANDPAAPFIFEAVRRGLITGCAGGNFCPNEPVNRGTLASFLAQAFEL